MAAMLIIAEVWQSLQHPSRSNSPGQASLINAGATFVNAVWALMLIRDGRAENRRHWSPTASTS